MQKQKQCFSICKAPLCVVLFYVLVFAVCIPAGASGATCTVNANTTYQEIQGFGASNAWSDCASCNGSAVSSWLVTHADELFTNTGTNIGLTILRARIAPDQGSWGSDTVNVIKAARDRGALIMSTAWTPPAAYKSNGAVDNQNGGYLLPEYYDEYANYLRDYVIYMRDTQKVNLYAVSPANEPDYQVGYDGCTWSGSQLRDFVKNNMGPVFTAAGLTTKIIVGESFSNALGITDPTLNDAAARGYTSIIAAHTYGGGPTNYPLCQTYNKDYWLTERSSFEAYDGTMAGTPGMGMVTAKWIHSALATANFNTFIYWWLASDQTNEGLRGVNNGIPKRYWVMGNWSKYVRPGYYRIAATANPVTNVYVSAYKDTANTNYVIIAVNDTTSSQSITFNLTGVGVTSFVPHITSETQDLATLASVAVSGASFTYNLPAKSVISFVGAMAAGSPTYTPTNTPYAGTPTFTITPTSTPNSILLDDMEDGDTNNNWGGNWYCYSGTSTTITPKPFTMTAGGMTGSTAYRAEIIATVGDFCGLGTNLNTGGTGVDISSYIALEFWVKGDGGSYWFHFTQADITSGDHYGMAFTAPATWTKVTVPIDQASLGKRGFGTETGDFAETAIIALQWCSNANGALDIQVDNVVFLASAALTPTYTPSRTATTAVSATFTQTRTPTHTYTHTPSTTAIPTSTFTATATHTAVPPTVTFTATLTATSNVSTMTFTATATRTIPPPTATLTASFTSTATAANSATFTATSTYTTSNTPTLTPTGTIPTATASPVVTFTNTVQPTLTGSEVPTSTNTTLPTPLNTQTATQVNTAMPTSTVTGTPTQANTATRTATATMTATATYTRTSTFTATKTQSPTFTRTFTPTSTRTMTATQTATTTATPTATLTHTITEVPATATATPTCTPTAEATKDALEITDVKSYPNPYDPASGSPLKIGFSLSRGVGYITVLVYTPAYRLIAKYTDPSDRQAGKGFTEVPASKFERAARGTYYAIVQAKDGAGKVVTSGTAVIIIQR